jgi:signal transduction histidine kinase
LLVLPIVVGDSRVGVVALESRKDGTLERCDLFDPLVAEYALPLETAALFDELRISAAAEERARLAREMHDGIAQDLAFLGYELDGLTATLRSSGAHEGVEHARQLRKHMTSLISDLRLSLSDLRSSIGPGRGLGAALSEYARSAGTSSGITVHLTLTEGSTRLPARVEVQLLRIAHEAVNRARRRPGATNLWVSLSVDPPCAVLVVEDDSPEEVVLPPAAGDTGDMSERAEKIGGRFSLEPREPIGSRLHVSVEGSPR